MNKKEGFIYNIPLWEHEKNTNYTSSAIPFKEVKEIMKNKQYLRIGINRNKFWNTTDKNHLPKFLIYFCSTTTEKEIEIDEDKGNEIEELEAKIENLTHAIRAYQLDGITDYLNMLDV